MSSTVPVDVLGVLGKDGPDLAEVRAARTAVYRDADLRRKAGQILAALPAEGKSGAARRGIALWVLGREADAAAALAGVSSRVARVLRAWSLANGGRPAEALSVLGDVRGDAEAAVVAAECYAALGDPDGLESAVAATKGAPPADAAIARGLLAEIRGEAEEAREAFDAAVEADPENPLALFRRARHETIYGDEDAAVEIYRRCLELPCPPVNAWLNLGNLYEDRGEFQKARDCFHVVLDADGTNDRARLFERDAAAAQEMFYDEDLERRSDKRSAVLRLPVTDFELSVRSRNCLAKMGVRTLGDLVQKTEAELLSYKNFGETSLQEIKDVLAQKGLRLGMSREEIARESAEARSILEGIGSDADRRKLLQKPLSELELSVRSRHCMNVLGLKSVAELVQKSEAELMTIKNFGQTSLNEVKQKLAELGLTLAPGPVAK
jgi:DNA-directed RNA polymerase subunit alpha